MTLKQFTAFQCIKCGKWQGKENRDARKKDEKESLKYMFNLVFKCKFCNNSFNFFDKNKRVERVKTKWFENSIEMGEYIRQISTKE
jgi:hypothetical protein